MTTYIYGLVDPDDLQIHYIGQTDNPTRRLSSHATHRDTSVKSAWLDDLAAKGESASMIILETTEDAESALVAENWWIAHAARLRWPINNVAGPVSYRARVDWARRLHHSEIPRPIPEETIQALRTLKSQGHNKTSALRAIGIKGGKGFQKIAKVYDEL